MPLQKSVSSAPKLSSEKNEKVEKPLEFLIQRFAEDPTTKWRRTYALGGKCELLAVVRHEHEAMPVRVDIITDLQSALVLHWGINKPGGQRGRERERVVRPCHLLSLPFL